MPCYGSSIPAKECQTGAKLRQVENSTCSGCYALRGNYQFPQIQAVLYKRMEAALNHPLWVEAMTVAIRHYEHSGYFRIHDSGDIQSVEHLEKWVQVARNLPKIKFWLPTREYGYVADFFAKGETLPKNFTLRLSAHITDGPAPLALAKRLGVLTSRVTRTENFNCPAPKQDNECGACRNCWKKSVATVTYHKH